MGFKITRKPFRIGASQAITLPHGWCSFYGDRIRTLTILGNTLLVIAPQGMEKQAEELAEMMEKPSTK